MSPMSSITDIKADLRAAMNGIASKAIKDSGMGYKLVYGVELPRLREMAADYEPDHRLAQALWQENIREYKMLAILLYPREEFDWDIADIWLADLPMEQAEIAQLLCMELLSTIPGAADHAFYGMADERPMYQLCGFLILTRLLMQGAVLAPDAEVEFLDQATSALSTTALPLKKAVTQALVRFGESSEEAQQKVDGILAAHL